MNTVFIVYNDSDVDTDIVGVFPTMEEAMAYSEEVSHYFSNGLLTSEFPIPYRKMDRATTIHIG